MSFIYPPVLERRPTIDRNSVHPRMAQNENSPSTLRSTGRCANLTCSLKLIVHHLIIQQLTPPQILP